MTDVAEPRAGGRVAFTPMQIATHALFTPREKLALLHRLKAEVTGERADQSVLGFAPAEIDAAIARVHRDAQAGGTDG